MFSSHFSCFSLNVRGLRDLDKRKALFLFCKSVKRDIYFLQETHSCVNDEKFWRNQWGSSISFCHNSSSSGGVAILLNSGFQGKVIETLSSGIGRWVISVVHLDSNFFIMINIYGFNSSANNKTLLDSIVIHINNLKLKYPSAFILFGGDFNEAPDLVADRFPPRHVSNSVNPLIANLCQCLNLIDAHRYLHPDTHMYTWFKSDFSQKSRIDLWLMSDSLISFLVSAEISPSPLTDHAVIDITLPS